jgi:hypothetical protein
MFPELRAVQIEVPRDVLEMREGRGEAPAHEAGASFSFVCAHRRKDSRELTSENVPRVQARFVARGSRNVVRIGPNIF